MQPNVVVTKKEKILIIEGDSAFAEKLGDVLIAGGYAPTIVKTGAEGLKAIVDVMPHMILLEIVLPGIEGYDILAQKQAEPLLAKIPVFLMSTQGVPINMRRVPANSVQEFIVTMHVEPAEILEKINKYFGYQSAPAKASTPTSSSGGKKLLWVEDDKLIGTILAKKIIGAGFDLVHAENGEAALELSKTMVPNGIVLDLLLPGLNGFEILQRIRMDERLKNVPVMILSNFSKPSDIEKAKLLGAQKFLVKAATSLDQIVGEIKELCK